MSARGFTLLELLFTVLILCILLTIGLPSFSSQIQQTKTKTAALELLEATEVARTLAASTNRRAVLRNQKSWNDGWEIFIDSNDNGVRDSSETIVRVHEKIDDVRISSNTPLKNYISFIGTGESRTSGKNNGGAFQAGTITVCPPKTGGGYKLVLARGGRMRITEIKAVDCVQ